MKRISLCLVIILGLLTIAGCSNNNKETEKENESYNSIVISDVDKETRWEAITDFAITLEFENGKCVSENYRLEFQKESNAIVYGMEMEDKTYIEDPEIFGYNENGTPYQEEITVSELTNYLQSPEKNTITVQNYKTQFDDLFQRMASTIQAVEFGTGNYTNMNNSLLKNRILNNDI